jgi:hypothetical protein
MSKNLETLFEGMYFVPQVVPDVQTKTIEALEKKGYKFVNWIKPAGPEEEEKGMGAALLTKRTSSYSSSHAEVEPDGTVNGESPEKYLTREDMASAPIKISQFGLNKPAIKETADEISDPRYKEALDLFNSYQGGTPDTKLSSAIQGSIEKAHQDMTDDSNLPDDDMADHEWDSEEVADELAEILKFDTKTFSEDEIYYMVMNYELPPVGFKSYGGFQNKYFETSAPVNEHDADPKYHALMEVVEKIEKEFLVHESVIDPLDWEFVCEQLLKRAEKMFDDKEEQVDDSKPRIS